MGRYSHTLLRIGKYFTVPDTFVKGYNYIIYQGFLIVTLVFFLSYSIYKVFDLKNYTMLYSISDKNVQEIKIR